MITEMKITLECGVCATPIRERVGKKVKKTSEYREIVVNLNNLSRMSVGVCSKHTSPTKLELDMITQKVRQGWMEEVALGVGNREWVESRGVNIKAVSLAGV